MRVCSCVPPGAPGSQNGFDNSGRRGPIEWDNMPPTNLYRTLSVIANLTEMLQPYAQMNGGPGQRNTHTNIRTRVNRLAGVSMD